MTAPETADGLAAPESKDSSTDRPRAAAGRAIVIYASKFKHLVLSLPCGYLAAMGIQLLTGGAAPDTLNIGLVVIGGGAAIVLLVLGFSPKPVLVIDDNGLYCRRPNIGLVPWAGIAGMGLGRAMLIRNVLIVAIDEAALPAETVERLKRERGSFLLHPELARYRGKMAGYPTVQISIALLATTPRALQQAMEEKVRYEGEPG